MKIKTIVFGLVIITLLSVSPVSMADDYPCSPINSCVTYSANGKKSFYIQFSNQDQKKNWSDASDACNDLIATNKIYKSYFYGHLATISTLAEKTALTNALNSENTKWIASKTNWIDGSLSASQTKILWTDDAGQTTVTSSGVLGNTGITIQNYTTATASTTLAYFNLDATTRYITVQDKNTLSPYICEIEKNN